MTIYCFPPAFLNYLYFEVIPLLIFMIFVCPLIIYLCLKSYFIKYFKFKVLYYSATIKYGQFFQEYSN